MKTVCVVRTLDAERELVILAIPDPEPSLAVVSVPLEDPSPEADIRVVAHGLSDADQARWAAIEHARDVADAELLGRRSALGTP